MAPTIGIIGALEKEVRQIYHEIEHGTVADEAGLTVMGGEYCGFNLVVTTAGMGTVNVAAAAQHLISRYGANALIFSGIAGGLNPALHIGDVVIGERLRYIDTDTSLIAESTPHLEEFTSSDFLVDLAEETLVAHGFVNAALAGDEADEARRVADSSPYRRNSADTEPARYLRGTIATGNRFITGAELRQAVVDATQADCAEMEGAAVAHIAAKNRIDCLVLRAISDNCDEAYDAFCEREFDLDEYARSASALTLSIVRRLSNKLRLTQHSIYAD
ncbi:5'-methylthioadenosine/S-adenosylhomocysteine nucleosidase [Collinsella tanakaei]|uniref:5'-methylthioadenosine/S-adenosylhomocysteine nucleosidase n=1 Tax=Collinsella tanakaei TaxID=626935 RepID=UPI00195DD6B8|nr:5'-methylthioadenosine/S-adenosylhomocysteine nucleosidase [Collinsella tanakaei]MBM6779870.1 5'-methylthioadenosine/S-adenosylhomocysteine nucleosidase [Collinsella tanakaei]